MPPVVKSEARNPNFETNSNDQNSNLSNRTFEIGILDFFRIGPRRPLRPIFEFRVYIFSPHGFGPSFFSCSDFRQRVSASFTPLFVARWQISILSFSKPIFS